MSGIFKYFHRIGLLFDKKAERFAFHHPCIAVLTMFVGLPLFIVLTVSVFTLMITVPISIWMS